MLATDACRTFAHFDLGQVAHGNECTGGGFHADFSDGPNAVPIGFRKSQGELKPALALIDLRRRSSADRGGDDLLYVGHIDAESGDLLPVDVDDKIGLSGDLFDFDVLDAVDLLDQGGNLLRLVAQHVEIVSEQLNGAFGSDAGDQFVHSFLNRLAHEDGDAGNLSQFLPNGVRQFRLSLRRLPGTSVVE